MKCRLDLVKDIEFAEVSSRTGNPILAFEYLTTAETKLDAQSSVEKKLVEPKKIRKPRSSIFDGTAAC